MLQVKIVYDEQEANTFLADLSAQSKEVISITPIIGMIHSPNIQGDKYDEHYYKFVIVYKED